MEAAVTLKLNPSEFDTIRDALEIAGDHYNKLYGAARPSEVGAREAQTARANHSKAKSLLDKLNQ